MAVLARLQERLQSLQEEYFLTYRYLGRAGGGAGYTASCWAGADGGRAPLSAGSEMEAAPLESVRVWAPQCKGDAELRRRPNENLLT